MVLRSSIDGKGYAILEDLDGCDTLAEACKGNRLSYLDRLSIACKVAKTVAFYHAAGLVLKSIADHTIVLKRLETTNVPYSVGVQNIREVCGRRCPDTQC